MNNILTKSRIQAPRTTSGFTLIEVIGALAVVALLVGVAAQSGFERLKQADRATEAADLSQIITGIERAVVRSRSLPTTSNWVAVVAGHLSRSTNQIARTRQGHTRVLLFDPNFRIGPSVTNTLPFVQSPTGSVLPSNARAVVVSSIASALPTLTATNFAALWNAASGTLPAGWANWGGSASDLRIERLDFSRLFRRVILNNLDSTAAAPYGVDGTNIVTIAPLQQVEGWFVDTSQVNLYFNTLALQARETLAEDTSYVFENGRWGRSVTYGTGAGSTELAELVDAFVDTPPLNNTAEPGGTGGTGGTGGDATGPYDCEGNDHDDDHDDDHGDHDDDHDDHSDGHSSYDDDHDGDHDGWDDHDCDHDGWDDHDGDHNGHDDSDEHSDDHESDDVRHGSTPHKVAESCHNFMKSYSEWSNRGCPRGGTTPDTEHPAYRNVKNACTSVRDFSRNLSRR